ncbi:MAG: hypothetical protein CME62_14380 [Halobacteriovoraceae bacterium]|nr:hypothetical protein [Halobacteriovoraceae bacterium]|tara:strand:- start:2367 stop:3179 length:813 start_codon:yes stop_codon:yes gene_type:complete
MKICLIQICSQLYPEQNMAKIDHLITQAKNQHSDIKAVFLPEVFYSMSDGLKPTEHLVAEGNSHYQHIQKLAQRHQVYLLGGSAAYLANDKVMNRNLNFSPEGELMNYYDKIHLFTLDLSQSADKTKLDERDLYNPGDELKLLDFEEFKLGLTICFDLRFPEIFRELYKKGANVFTVSSAFTKPTGMAHWKTLVRARAIENQSYVIACNQWGEHNPKMRSYGHSMVVDPWGDILVDMGEGEDFAVADISIERVNEIRSRMDMTSRFTYKD